MQGVPKVGDFDSNYHIIKPVYDVANNKLHYQTEPFLDEDGVLKVKRLASYDVKVEPIYQVVEEYNLKSEEQNG